MNDARIQELVRMALEVDDLEGIARSDAAASRPVVRRLWWAGAGLAAAAAIGVAVLAPGLLRAPAPGVPIVVAPEVEPSVVSGPGPTPGIVDRGNPAPAPLDIKRTMNLPNLAVTDWHDATEGNVVLAIYQDPSGGMRCVQMKPHEWEKNRCLPDVPQQELRSVPFGEPCAEDPAHTLLVALHGPRRALPKTEAGAVALAQCILGGSTECGTRPPCIQRAASECLPSEVSVRVETVAARGR